VLQRADNKTHDHKTGNCFLTIPSVTLIKT